MRRLYQTLTLLFLIPLFLAFQKNFALAADACTPNPCPPTRPKCTVITGGSGRLCAPANQIVGGDPVADNQGGLSGGCVAGRRCINTVCTLDSGCASCSPADGCGSASGCPEGTICLSNGNCSPDQHRCPTQTNSCSTQGGCGPANGCLEGQTCTSYGTCYFVDECGGHTSSDPQTQSIFGSLSTFLTLSENYQGSATAVFFILLYKALLPIAIIIGLILIAVAGWTLMTSQGDPQKAQEGKEQLTSAIMGLLFVLLGVGILRALVGILIKGEPSGF